MKLIPLRYWWSVVLFLSLLPAAGAAAMARDLSPAEEARLFFLADLGPVDVSAKTVTVEVYVSPDPELDLGRRLLPRAWEQVQQFYARLGVNLAQAPGGEQPGPLAPAKRLRLELLADKQWLNRSFKAFDVAPPFRLRFLQVCKDKCAFAHLPLSTTQISFKRFKDAELGPEARDHRQNEQWLANLLAHELGHLMGLYHCREFTDDPVALSLKGSAAPNFMSTHVTVKQAMGFTEIQKRLVHSYLGGGKVFQQYQAVEFDPLRYLEVLKRVNGFRETAPARGNAPEKVSLKVLQKQVKTFDDNDDEDDEDD